MDLMTEGEALSLNRAASADRKRAEHFILHYQEELAAYRAEREDFVSLHGEVPETKGFQPTERIVVRGQEFDRTSEARRWLQAVEVVERGLPDQKRLFLQARRAAEVTRGTGFRQGRPGWVAQTQQLYTQAMEREYLDPCAWLAERTVKAWWQDLVARVAETELRIEVLLLDHEQRKTGEQQA